MLAYSFVVNSEHTDVVSQSLRILNSVAKQLKQRRIENGALVLASPEVRFQLERDTSDPMEVGACSFFFFACLAHYRNVSLKK